MTFALNFTRGMSLGVLAAALTLGSVSAQNGSNYDLLSNSFDAAYVGIGAGGGQTAVDGILTHIRGENLKGSHMTQLGDFGYRQPKFRETMCVFNAGPVTTALRFPALMFVEMASTGGAGAAGNGNKPLVFTNPACKPGGPQFPLGASGAVPYGTVPGATANFILSLTPSGIPGIPTSTLLLLPNDALAGTGPNNGTATLIAAASASLPIASTGFCWAVQFTWNPSALASLDDVDSWEHYLENSADGNQYWGVSDDELNIWQSSSVVLDGGGTGLIGLPANFDYGFTSSTVEPTTKASLAPVGANAAGVYYAQTVNVVKENGAPAINLNGGFDVGRGSEVLSLSGTKGVANPATLLGNQDPTAAGKTPTIGFATWDNGGDHNGSVRLGFLSIDLIALSPTPAKPSTDVGVIKPFFGIRIPVVSAGLLQGITNLSFGLFGTKTSGTAWPDPDGFPPGTFGVQATGAASNQFPTTGLTVCPVVVSLPVNITYGSVGRKDGPGGVTYNPAIADTSGMRELFLFD